MHQDRQYRLYLYSFWRIVNFHKVYNREDLYVQSQEQCYFDDDYRLVSRGQLKVDGKAYQEVKSPVFTLHVVPVAQLVQTLSKPPVEN